MYLIKFLRIYKQMFKRAISFKSQAGRTDATLLSPTDVLGNDIFILVRVNRHFTLVLTEIIDKLINKQTERVILFILWILDDPWIHWIPMITAIDYVDISTQEGVTDSN